MTPDPEGRIAAIRLEVPIVPLTGTNLAPSAAMKTLTHSLNLLGWGSVAFGTWGMIDPDGLTRLMGDDPAIGRLLGVRDTLIGAALLGAPGPLPLSLRLAGDLHDAIRLRQRSPKAALGAAAFALIGAVTLAGMLAQSQARLNQPASSY